MVCDGYSNIRVIIKSSEFCSGNGKSKFYFVFDVNHMVISKPEMTRAPNDIVAPF